MRVSQIVRVDSLILTAANAHVDHKFDRVKEKQLRVHFRLLCLFREILEASLHGKGLLTVLMRRDSML